MGGPGRTAGAGEAAVEIDPVLGDILADEEDQPRLVVLASGLEFQLGVGDVRPIADGRSVPQNPDNGQLQCEPTNCALGVGLASPMWTDMVNGTNRITVCGYAVANSDRLGYSACTAA